MKKIGVFDLTFEKTNPINDKPYSENYKKLASMWQALPAFQHRELIIKEIVKNQVTLLISSTGSGKSLITSQYIICIKLYRSCNNVITKTTYS